LFRNRRFIALLALAACLSACGLTKQTESEARINLGQERARYSFDTDQTAWDVFSLDGDQAVFRVMDGVLEGAVVADRGYIWSLENNRYSGVAVTVTVQQTQGSKGNGFGLLCRADEDGNGYYFVISSAGQFAILKATSDADDPLPLVEWQSSSAIQVEDKPNTLQAICAGDTLTFYANGQFLAETHDLTFSGGEVGVVLGAVDETLWVNFDNIIVQDAELVG
jgi:hypothetical protein